MGCSKMGELLDVEGKYTDPEIQDMATVAGVEKEPISVRGMASLNEAQT